MGFGIPKSGFGSKFRKISAAGCLRGAAKIRRLRSLRGAAARSCEELAWSTAADFESLTFPLTAMLRCRRVAVSGYSREGSSRKCISFLSIISRENVMQNMPTRWVDIAEMGNSEAVPHNLNKTSRLGPHVVKYTKAHKSGQKWSHAPRYCGAAPQ